MDIVAENYPLIAEKWYEFEFITILWLILPFTDGSTLLFERITSPLLLATAKDIKDKAEAWMPFLILLVNSTFLWILWFVFVTLEEEAKRFIVIAVGTIYPIAASTVACTTDKDKNDDSFWLTYWVCFSILFIAMDYLENFVGEIPGFYSLCLCTTVYLFLPMVRFTYNIQLPSQMQTHRSKADGLALFSIVQRSRCCIQAHSRTVKRAI